jgi:hypothetical protein
MIGHKCPHSLQRQRGRGVSGILFLKLLFIRYRLVNDDFSNANGKGLLRFRYIPLI